MTADFEQSSLRSDTPRLVGAVSLRSLRIRLYFAMLASDVMCIALSFVAGAFIRFGDLNGFGWFGVTGSILMLFTLCAVLTGAYSLEALRSSTIGIARALSSLMLSFAILSLLTYFLKSDARFSRIITGTSFIIASIALSLSRQFLNDWVERRLKSVLTNELVLCDGVAFEATSGVRILQTAEIGLRPDPRDASMLFLLAGVVQGADRVIVACSAAAAPKWALMLKGTNIQGEILATEFDALGPTGVAKLNGRSTLVVSSGPLNVRQRMTKRLFDLALTVPALLILLPVLGLIALLVKLDSPGSVIFKQRRVGRGNALFHIYKFRTMIENRADCDGARSASRDDDRTTRLGRFLRRTSLDELPQLVNVLLGSMSIVGPRPHALKSRAGEELFWHIDESYWHRHALKPGITGLAQVRGFRGATDTSEDLRSRLHSDLEYISGWSLWRDLSIVARTARVLIHSNAY